jgi:hypothetical protein
VDIHFRVTVALTGRSSDVTEYSPVDNAGPAARPCERDPVTAVRRREPADLVLGPATRLLWRSPGAVHLELGSRGVVVAGLPIPLIQRIASPIVPDAPPVPVDDSVRHALTALTEAGYLWVRSTDDDARLAPPAPRLAGELTALAARHGERAAELLNARRHTSVVIHGRSRAAAPLAAVLAAAGIGRVRCTADGDAKLFQAIPGGIRPHDEGTLFAAAAEDAIHRAAPEADTTPLPVDVGPDLTILAVDAPVPDERRHALHAADAAHLTVSLGADHGVVGPLVLPGLTSCLHCADLHRRDRDPAWSALAVQLTVPGRHGPASDVAVATVIAGVAALQALTFLDGGEPACLDGTLELRLPDWRLRRRSWPAHPDCDCTAAAVPRR